MEISTEIKAQLNLLRQVHPEILGWSDEQLMALIQQAMQEETEHDATPGEADMARMSAEECGAMGQQLLQQGRWQEAEWWLFAGLKKAEQAGDLDIQCKTIGLLGQLCSNRGDTPQAMELSQQALGLAERLGDLRVQGTCYNQIGSIFLNQGLYPQAIKHYCKGLEIEEKLGDEEGLAGGYGNLGNVYWQQGDLDDIRHSLCLMCHILNNSLICQGVVDYGLSGNFGSFLGACSPVAGAVQAEQVGRFQAA